MELGGLTRGEFFVAFQPVLDAESGHLESFEALLRWDRPGFGEQRPGTFLPELESSGRLAPLTDFVLAAACASAARWPDCDGTSLRLRVNICASELTSPQLAGRVCVALSVSGLQPERLVLEVAAGDLPDVAAARRTCAGLLALGVTICLDGYGTDERALDRIRQLGCTEIKLAKVLVDDVVRHPEAVLSVRQIVDLARALGVSVIVDGIESSQQLRLLVATGARGLQGFHLGAPSLLSDPDEVLAADREAGQTLGGGGACPCDT